MLAYAVRPIANGRTNSKWQERYRPQQGRRDATGEASAPGARRSCASSRGNEKNASFLRLRPTSQRMATFSRDCDSHKTCFNAPNEHSITKPQCLLVAGQHCDAQECASGRLQSNMSAAQTSLRPHSCPCGSSSLGIQYTMHFFAAIAHLPLPDGLIVVRLHLDQRPKDVLVLIRILRVAHDERRSACKSSFGNGRGVKGKSGWLLS